MRGLGGGRRPSYQATSPMSRLQGGRRVRLLAHWLKKEEETGTGPPVPMSSHAPHVVSLAHALAGRVGRRLPPQLGGLAGGSGGAQRRCHHRCQLFTADAASDAVACSKNTCSCRSEV